MRILRVLSILKFWIKDKYDNRKNYLRIISVFNIGKVQKIEKFIH